MIEKCQSCKKPFKVIENKLGMPGTKEKEPIDCPYCNYTIQRTTNGTWQTFPLTEEEQKNFLEGN